MKGSGVENVKALGHALRRYRAAACLTQDELAAKTGMSQKKYSRIETGQIQDPGLADVVCIGRVFGLTPDFLAELAGIWAPSRKRPVHDERWAAIFAFMDDATPAQRSRFLDIAYGIMLGIGQRSPDRVAVAAGNVATPHGENGLLNRAVS